jgi:hypothetical protein
MSRFLRPWRTSSISSRSRRVRAGAESARASDRVHAFDEEARIRGLEHHALGLEVSGGEQLRLVHPRGQEDHRRPHTHPGDAAQNVESRSVGQVDVEQHEVGLELRDLPASFGDASGAAEQLIAAAAKEHVEGGPDHRMVVDKQDTGHAAAPRKGRLMRTLVDPGTD